MSPAAEAEAGLPGPAGLPERADVCVVGGGPAGLLAAIASASAGRRTVLIEKQERCGTKLAAAGGGRGNLASTDDDAAFMARFGRQGRFMAPALDRMNAQALRAFLQAAGVLTYDEEGRVFPQSNSAAAVRSTLVLRAAQLGVHVVYRRRVTELRLEAPAGGAERRVAGVAGEGWTLHAPGVVLACGGAAWPALGGGRDGLDLAAQAGHAIVPPLPALVPLICKEDWLGDCAGSALRGARIWIDQARHARAGVTGDVLFTHRGLSGPAVLDISGQVAQALGGSQEVKVALDLCPGLPAGAWEQRLEEWRTRCGARGIRSLLDEHLPAALAAAVCAQAGLAGSRASQVAQAQRRRLIDLLTQMALTVVATAGLERAMVMRGGVSLRQVDPHTLQSRLAAGLYLAGELLDLDGPTGGYNLQWAFASGHLAGLSAAGQ